MPEASSEHCSSMQTHYVEYTARTCKSVMPLNSYLPFWAVACGCVWEQALAWFGIYFYSNPFVDEWPLVWESTICWGSDLRLFHKMHQIRSWCSQAAMKLSGSRGNFTRWERIACECAAKFPLLKLGPRCCGPKQAYGPMHAMPACVPTSLHGQAQ
jgi:hypothetical protein